MVGFKVCLGTLAVIFGLVPLFIIIYLFVYFPSCRTFPHFVQTGRCQRHCSTHGLRSTLGRKGVMQSVVCALWSPGFAFSDASVYTLKTTLRRSPLQSILLQCCVRPCFGLWLCAVQSCRGTDALHGEGTEELSLRKAEQWVLLGFRWLPGEQLTQGKN
ncbi:hypothetical protein DV515_00011956 [Chloebia gouldiae]|uniref:Uncharacterized protein n=1 Tax=Chloebia gouldiae TaxID=44316 RepID=A0A3L8S564_CHLGU|nr:hypothetical protein DV515_00011956 [Chloebia gouldiae]